MSKICKECTLQATRHYCDRHDGKAVYLVQIARLKAEVAALREEIMVLEEQAMKPKPFDWIDRLIAKYNQENNAE